MSTVTHSQPDVVSQTARRSGQLVVREMWASLAITAMWVAVVFAAIFAPDIVTSDAGGNRTTIPSGVAVGLFAVIGTRIVAKYGFGRQDEPAAGLNR
jgi:hypothetical protein